MVRGIASGSRRAEKAKKARDARSGVTTVARRRMKLSPSDRLRRLEESRWAWIVDLNSVFIWSSSDSYPLIGYRPEELVGRNVGLVMDMRELTRAEAMINAVGLPEDGLSNLIISASHRDGSAPWFEVSIQPSTDSRGEVIGFRGIARFIGPDAAQVLATQRVRRRIEHIIDNGLLMTAFQPIVDVQNWTIVGVEALSRFVEDPGTAPDVWFAEASAIGLGAALELRAVRTALTAAQALPTHLYVSVNVAPMTCLDPALRQIVAESGIDPRRLILEVTEHSQVADYGPLTTVLTELRACGIRIAVDDAGAGFASGQHILKIKPDIIKLDRGIITAIDTEPGQRALAAGLVAFATHIGAQVTAEGVETLRESTCIRELGIQCVQGFFYGRPTVERREWASWTASPASAAAMSTALQPPGLSDVGASMVHVGFGEQADPDRGVDADTGAPPHRRRSSSDAKAEPVRYGAFAVAVLDALPDATAVLDGTGVIVAVNRAWRTFTVEGGGYLDATGVGISYLEVCSRSAAAGATDALEALVGLQAVLSGETDIREWEYPCPTPSGVRWFLSRITAMEGTGSGAVVSHVDITRRKRSEEELAHRASHDPLTGLANRLLLGQRLGESLRRRARQLHPLDVGVLYIDLDSFKPVHDSLGHAAGDDLLTVVAHRLNEQVRSVDTAARMGGDEFAVCVPGVTESELATMADRLTVALSMPYRIRGREVRISVSIGRHLATAGDDPDAALHAADRDMYHAKGIDVRQGPALTA